MRVRAIELYRVNKEYYKKNYRDLVSRVLDEFRVTGEQKDEYFRFLCAEGGKIRKRKPATPPPQTSQASAWALELAELARQEDAPTWKDFVLTGQE